MKKVKKTGAACLFLLMLAGSLFAQQFQKGMTVGGATGLFVLPTGRIGWEKSQFAFDVGYGGFFGHDFKNYGNLVKANFSMFKIFEIGASWDGELGYNNSKLAYSNVIIHTKIQAYKNNAASLAIGGNLQINNIGKNRTDFVAGQIYIAATYSGTFFSWPASSTLVFGKSFYKPFNWDFDLGMGFELSLFPKTFKDYIALIVELGNFSYVSGGNISNTGLNSASRGLANVGLRIDPIKDKKYKLGIDIIGTDLLDDNRSLGLQVCFGLAF